VGNPLANHVPVVLTRICRGNPLAKHVPFVNTKNKVGKLLAKHVAMVFTALLAHPVVHTLQLLVLLEPMPVEQQPFVIHVNLANTAINRDKLLNLVAKTIAMLAPTSIPIKPSVSLVFRGNTKTKTINQIAKHVILENCLWVKTQAKHACSALQMPGVGKVYVNQIST